MAEKDIKLVFTSKGLVHQHVQSYPFLFEIQKYMFRIQAGPKFARTC